MKTIDGAILRVTDGTVQAWDAAAVMWRDITIYTETEVNEAPEASADLIERLNA